jgi:hypothetical protein
MSSTSALRRGSDAGAVASGIGKYAGRLAIALIDASIIGASAVALSTAYAIGDVLSLRHSLHRKPSGAKGFYAVYCGLIGCRRARPDARRTARALDQCGAGPRRSPIAERHGVPAAALQRQAVGPHRATIGACRRCTNCPPAICRSRRGRGCLFCAPISSSLAASSWCGSRRWPSATTEKTEGPRAPLGSCGEHPTWECVHPFNAATNLSLAERNMSTSNQTNSS